MRRAIRMPCLPSAVAALATVVATAASAGTIDTIDLELGRARTIVAGPVWVAAADFRLEIGTFTHEFDYGKLLVDHYGRSGTRDYLQRGVDLGGIFAGELGRQARELGLPTGGGSWRVSGVVEDIYVKNREILFGPLIFSGHVDVRFEVVSPAGEKSTARMRFRPTTARYNAGLGTKDENREAVAQIVIEAAQEALARLNQRYFRQPAHARSADKIADVRRAGAKPEEDDVRWLGLSGAPEAIEPLLAVLDKAEDESVRAEAVEALLVLGATEVVPELCSRYAKEDEDVRCAILAAVPELDPVEGVAWLASGGGARDKNKACQHVALRRMGRTR